MAGDGGRRNRNPAGGAGTGAVERSADERAVGGGEPAGAIAGGAARIEGCERRHVGGARCDSQLAHVGLRQNGPWHHSRSLAASCALRAASCALRSIARNGWVALTACVRVPRREPLRALVAPFAIECRAARLLWPRTLLRIDRRGQTRAEGLARSPSRDPQLHSSECWIVQRMPKPRERPMSRPAAGGVQGTRVPVASGRMPRLLLSTM